MYQASFLSPLGTTVGGGGREELGGLEDSI